MDAEVLARVEPFLLRLLAKRPSIRGGRPDDGRLILLQHEQQAVGRNRTHPDGERAELLCAHDVGAADVEREVQPVHIAVVRTHTRLPEKARFGRLPQVEVLLREGAHRGNASRTGRGRHEHDVFLGNGAHLAEETSNMLRLALRLLIDEGKLLDVGERGDILGLHACLIERALVVHRVLVCVLHHRLQALELEFF